MLTLTYELYETICDLLTNENLSVEEIATMANTTPEIVRFVSAQEEI